jgi:FkbM family methyltransferase
LRKEDNPRGLIPDRLSPWAKLILTGLTVMISVLLLLEVDDPDIFPERSLIPRDTPPLPSSRSTDDSRMAGLSLIERALLFYGTRLPDHPRKWWLHGHLRRSLGVAVDRDIEVIRRGLRWSLNPADYGHESLFWTGTKNQWDLYHLCRLVPPDGMVLDVGANFGYYALALAKALDRRCMIHALEPNPASFDRLVRHIHWNDLGDVVLAHRLGLSDRAESVRMCQPRDNAGHAAVTPDGDIPGVSLTTLDAFCATVGLNRLEVVILDVEGFEERALEGARGTLARFMPLVFVELFPSVMGRQGSSPEAAARILTALGYLLFVARRDRLESLTVLPAGDACENVFGFHRDKLPDSLRTSSSSSG